MKHYIISLIILNIAIQSTAFADDSKKYNFCASGTIATNSKYSIIEFENHFYTSLNTDPILINFSLRTTNSSFLNIEELSFQLTPNNDSDLISLKSSNDNKIIQVPLKKLINPKVLTLSKIKYLKTSCDLYSDNAKLLDTGTTLRICDLLDSPPEIKIPFFSYQIKDPADNITNYQVYDCETKQGHFNYILNACSLDEGLCSITDLKDHYEKVIEIDKDKILKLQKLFANKTDIYGYMLDLNNTKKRIQLNSVIFNHKYRTSYFKFTDSINQLIEIKY